MSRVGLVTGASRGIGRGIASELARQGVQVAVHCNARRDAAVETLSALDGTGHQVFAADLGDAEAARRLVDEVTAHFGRLDIVVNNAGIYEMHSPLTTSWERWRDAWDATLAVDLLGPAHLTYAAARFMSGHGGGRIVNVSSRGAVRGEPDAPAYAAAKAGLNAMSQSLARALGPAGIFVYVVAPGWVATDMASEHLAGAGGDEIRAQSPLGRVARVEEIARTVAFLALDETEYLTGGIFDAFGASYLRS